MHLIEQLTFGANHADGAGDQCGNAHVAVTIYCERIKQLVAIKSVEQGAMGERRRSSLDNTRTHNVPFPDTPDRCFCHVHRRTIGRQSDPVRFRQSVGRAHDGRSISKGVIEAAVVGISRTTLAKIGKPEPAVGVEDDVIWATQLVTVALCVHGGDLTSFDHDALN